MNAHFFYHIDSPIVYIETLEDSLVGVLCRNSQLYIIDTSSEDVIAQYNINRISFKAHSANLSKDGNYFAYIQEHPNQLNVIDLRTQKLVHSISTHRHEVEIVHFDSYSKYIIAGTKTGRVFLWSVSSANHIARLSSFPEYSKNYLPPKENFVSVVTSFNDFAITSGYGGSIVITNLQTQFKTKRIHSNMQRVNALCMLNEHTLVCASQDGLIKKIHLKENSEQRQLNTSIRNIKQMLLLSDKQHLLINNTTSQIALIDTKALKVLELNFISTGSIIEHISLDEQDSLFIALNNGQVIRYNLNPTEEFERLINLTSYTKAYELANQAISLKGNDLYKDLERKFLEAYHKAQEALLQDHKVFAHSLLKEFVKVPSKAKVIHNLFYAMQHYPRLSYLLSTKRYAAAYRLSETYQPLQLTPTYKQMQKQFEIAFGQAQKYSIKKEYAKAKTALAPFATVAQKSPLIHLITNSPTSILRFSTAIHNKEYKNILSLTSSYPILKTLTSYIEFEKECDNLMEALIVHVQNGDIDTAIEYLQEIKKIPRFTQQIKSLEKFIKEAERFYNYYEHKNFLQCFVIIDRSPSIHSLALVSELNEEWKELILDCEELALKGDVLSIKSILLDLINLQSRETKLANIFRMAYQVQLADGIHVHKQSEITKAFENYLNIFGLDTEVLDLIASIEEKGITLSLKKSLFIRKARNSWFVYKETLPEFIYT